jgi:TfoX/Sxy family transcriptional regulator of competence genes
MSLERYERLVATNPKVERKGKTLPYTSLNGHMFSFLGENDTIALRLSPDDRQAFIDRYGASLHETHGTVMREYVRVPDELADDTAALAPWFDRSYRYVAGLKPKPTKRAR